MPYPVIDTFSSLIDEVITSLQGYGTANDQVVTLTSDMLGGDLTMQVDDSDSISRGLVEIDEEIVYVTDADNGTVTIPAFGRGFKGTTAAAHAAGSPVWVAPTWPRAAVAREINNTIKSLYPSLFGVATVELTSTTATWQYGLPAECERVLAVEWRYNYPDGWTTVKSWESVFSANTTDFPTGRSLLIGEPLPTNGKIHVTYATLPKALSLPENVFTLSGLAPSCRDVVVLGTAARLVPWQDTARLPVETVPSDALDNNKPVGNATSVAGAIRQQFQLRLDQERRALLDRYPTRTHRTR
jgi:hypothetical protein